MTDQAFKSEDQLQAHCFQWTWNEFPETRRLFFKVKNESENGIPTWIKNILKKYMPTALALLQKHNNPLITGGKDKATGLIAGVADMILLWKAKAYFFEFKFDNGKQSQSQKEFEYNVTNQGFDYYLVNDAEQFKIIFTKIITQ
jgi:hypothetical protein